MNLRGFYPKFAIWPRARLPPPTIRYKKVMTYKMFSEQKLPQGGEIVH